MVPPRFHSLRSVFSLPQSSVVQRNIIRFQYTIIMIDKTCTPYTMDNITATTKTNHSIRSLVYSFSESYLMRWSSPRLVGDTFSGQYLLREVDLFLRLFQHHIDIVYCDGRSERLNTDIDLKFKVILYG